MSEPLTVGVAVPMLNAARYIADALRSVVAQTYPVADIVVVDDGSDDDSAAIAAAVDPRVRVISRPHAGIGATRTIALARVRGAVVMPLDADDLLTPHSVACRIGLLQRRPELDVIYGQMRNFAQLLDGAPVALDALRPAHLPNTMLIRRASYERVGAFREGVRVSEALDWALRAREVGLHEATVPDQVLWRRVHGANNSILHRAAIGEFPRALKESLDRRRASGG